MTDKWKKLSKSAGVPISKFVVDHVENSLNQEEKEDYQRRADLIEQIKTLNETLKGKEKTLQRLETLVEKLEEDLRLHRSWLFTDESYAGKRQYDRKLARLLQEPGPHTSDDILIRLGVDPRESEAVKDILRQIENLRDYGLVKATGRGWTWVEAKQG